MPSTPTTQLRLEQQGLGENVNTWGDDRLNRVLRSIAQAIAGVESIALVDGTTTLTSTNYAVDQARNACLIFTGSITQDTQVVIPDEEKIYVVFNDATLNGHTLSIGTAAGITVDLIGTGVSWVMCDGMDTRLAWTTDYNGERIQNVGTPTVGADAATKKYADDLDAARKTYIDTKPVDSFPAPTADFGLGGFKLIDLGAPVEDADAATKKYVDDTALKMASGGLPGQTSKAGRVIETDGTNARWSHGMTPGHFFLGTM